MVHEIVLHLLLVRQDVNLTKRYAICINRVQRMDYAYPVLDMLALDKDIGNTMIVNWSGGIIPASKVVFFSL